MLRIVALVLSLFMLAACTNAERGAVAGAAIGGGGAALAGANTGGIVLGTAGGAVVGGLIGRSVDRRGYCRYRDGNGATYEAPCS